jgi:hypothetical protein
MFLRIISLLIASSTITACSLLPTNQASNNLDVIEDSKSLMVNGNNSNIAPSNTSITPDRPFPAPTLYSLLVAEIAG